MSTHEHILACVLDALAVHHYATISKESFDDGFKFVGEKELREHRADMICERLPGTRALRVGMDEPFLGEGNSFIQYLGGHAGLNDRLDFGYGLHSVNKHLLVLQALNKRIEPLIARNNVEIQNP